MLTRRDMILSALGGLAGGLSGLPAGAQAAGTGRMPGRPLRVLVPEGSQANVAPVCALFEARHGTLIEILVTDLDAINATLAVEAVTRRQQIDLALPATFGLPDLAEAGAILPLDSPDGQGRAPPGDAGELYRIGDMFDGRRWGYQTDGDIYMMFYLRDLLHDPDEQAAYADRHGTALGVARDWAELDRQMAWFHRPDAGLYGGCFFRTDAYAAWEWWARFHARGVWPFSPQMAPQIAGEAGIGALEDMIRSAQSLVATSAGLFENWARYKRGDIFANIGWGGTQKSLCAPGSPVGDRVLAAGLPHAVRGAQSVPMAYFNWGWSYVVTRHCPAPELAHGFARFAVSPEASALAVSTTDGYFDPFRLEHYRDPRIRKVYGGAFLDVHRAAMQRAMPDLYMARRADYFGALGHWLGRALSREESPERALRNVEDAWNLTTELAGRDRQIQRWSGLRASYPPDLRAFLEDLPGP